MENDFFFSIMIGILSGIVLSLCLFCFSMNSRLTDAIQKINSINFIFKEEIKKELHKRIKKEEKESSRFTGVT